MPDYRITVNGEAIWDDRARRTMSAALSVAYRMARNPEARMVEIWEGLPISGRRRVLIAGAAQTAGAARYVELLEGAL